MKPSDLQLDDPAPQRVLITSRQELRESVRIALRLARRTVRCLQRDLSVFELASPAPAAGCASCAYSARAEKGMRKQPSET